MIEVIPVPIQELLTLHGMPQRAFVSFFQQQNEAVLINMKL